MANAISEINDMLEEIELFDSNKSKKLGNKLIDKVLKNLKSSVL